MRIVIDRPIVMLSWDEMCEMMDEIPIDRLTQLSWFRWNMESRGKEYSNIDRTELYRSILTEIETQV